MLRRAHLDVTIGRDPGLVREALAHRKLILGVDADAFDPHCEHIVLRDNGRADAVGTARILSPVAARHTGYFLERQFDLALVALLRERMVELGPICISPGYRSRIAFSLFWSTVARYLIDRGHDYVLASAAISVADGGHLAASLYRAIAERHGAPVDYRVIPRRRLPIECLRVTVPATVPPIFGSYLEQGAWLCGEPATDPESGNAEFPLLIPLSRMRDRFARSYLARAA